MLVYLVGTEVVLAELEAGVGIGQRSTTNSFVKCAIPIGSQELLLHYSLLIQRTRPRLLLAVSLTVLQPQFFLEMPVIMDSEEVGIRGSGASRSRNDQPAWSGNGL